MTLKKHTQTPMLWYCWVVGHGAYTWVWIIGVLAAKKIHRVN